MHQGFSIQSSERRIATLQMKGRNVLAGDGRISLLDDTVEVRREDGPSRVERNERGQDAVALRERDALIIKAGRQIGALALVVVSEDQLEARGILARIAGRWEAALV